MPPKKPVPAKAPVKPVAKAPVKPAGRGGPAGRGAPAGRGGPVKKGPVQQQGMSCRRVCFGSISEYAYGSYSPCTSFSASSTPIHERSAFKLLYFPFLARLHLLCTTNFYSGFRVCLLLNYFLKCLIWLAVVT